MVLIIGRMQQNDGTPDISDLQKKDFFISLTTDDGETWTADKTYEQIVTAIVDEKRTAYADIEGAHIPMIGMYDYDEGAVGFVFYLTIFTQDGISAIAAYEVDFTPDGVSVLMHTEELSGGGGSAPLVVTVTEINGVYTADKTFAEIQEAYLAGRSCHRYDGRKYTELTFLNINHQAIWTELKLNNDKSEVIQIVISVNNTVTKQTTSLTDSDSFITEVRVDNKIAEAISGAIGGAY